MNFALAIARATIAEAIGSRLVVLALTLAACVLAGALFAGELALTEAREVRATLAGAALRAGMVFLLIAFVVSSLVREHQDQIIAVALSHAVPRGAFVLGKLTGFSVIGTGFAIGCGILMWILNPQLPTLWWTVSLALELAIVAAASLFFALTLTHFVAAFAAAAGMYLLARSMSAIQIIALAAGDGGSLTDRLASIVVTALAWVLPHFDLMTRGAWLGDPSTPASVLLVAIMQTVIYLPLLGAAALFDFSRRNL